jgi:protein TonB
MATVSHQYGRHPLQAFGLAVAIEFAVLASAGVVLAMSESAKHTISVPVPIVLANEELPPVKPPEPEPKPIPKSDPRPAPQTPPPQPVPMASVPTAFTEPVPPPPPPPADTSAAQPSADYLARVNAAVKASHICPVAATSLHYTGKVRVDFHLRNTEPGEIRLLVASGFGMIDRAALQAVQNAVYPEQPAEIKGNDYVYQVWIECK